MEDWGLEDGRQFPLRSQPSRRSRSDRTQSMSCCCSGPPRRCTGDGAVLAGVEDGDEEDDLREVFTLCLVAQSVGRGVDFLFPWNVEELFIASVVVHLSAREVRPLPLGVDVVRCCLPHSGPACFAGEWELGPPRPLAGLAVSVLADMPGRFSRQAVVEGLN